MSQRWVYTKDHMALSGWDRPLQYLFLCVYDRKDKKVYSNLDDSRNVTGSSGTCRGMEMMQLRQRWNEHMGGDLPAWLHRTLLRDRQTDAGDITTYHDIAGKEVPRVVAV